MKRAYRRREDHSSWRRQLVEELAEALEPERHGVVALYVLGSTKNGDAGPESDIDVIVHVRGGVEQRHALEETIRRWDEHAWNLYRERTGGRSSSVGIDAHIITDEDIARRTSFAAKIGAHTDAARLVRQYRA